MPTLYTNMKVNNEIELCEVSDPDCKKAIESALLKLRISYYIRFPKTSIFSRKKDSCVICINDNVRDEAEALVRSICDEKGYNVRFIMKRSPNDYL